MLESSEISSELIHSALIKIIKNELHSDTFKLTVESASQAGDNNFIGIVYRVHFEEENEDTIDSEKRPTSSVILKVAPQNLARRNQFRSRSCFLREINLYDKVSDY